MELTDMLVPTLSAGIDGAREIDVSPRVCLFVVALEVYYGAMIGARFGSLDD